MTQGILSPPANVRPPGLKNVGIEQRLDEQIPPELAFRNEAGKPVHLADYFGKKPIILNLVYYQCPMLCGEVLSGLESALRVMKFDVGKEFDVLTISFDPGETPEMAAKKKAEFLKRYGRAGAEQGWHFLTGPKESIDALTKAVGFQYEYINKTGTVVDQVLLYCYHYDPATGKYGAIISRILQLAGVATIIIMGVFIAVMIRVGSDRQLPV